MSVALAGGGGVVIRWTREHVRAARSLGLIAACWVVAWSSGCSSLQPVGLLPAGEQGSRAGVEVRVFEDAADHAAGAVSPPHVVGELERFENGSWHPIFRTLGPNWVVVDLEPGRYRVRIPAVLDAQGREVRVHRLRQALEVEAGTISRIEAILEDRTMARKAFGVLGKVALVAGALAIDLWLDDEPEPYDPYPIYEPVTVTDIVLEAVTEDDEEAPAADGAAAPLLLTHFPEDGAVVAGSGIRIVVALSTPLVPGSIGPAALVVRTAGGEVVPGRVAYDGRRWWLTWSPLGDLPAGEELLVRVSLPEATDWTGRDLTEAPLFAFRTTGEFDPLLREGGWNSPF